MRAEWAFAAIMGIFVLSFGAVAFMAIWDKANWTWNVLGGALCLVMLVGGAIYYFWKGEERNE